MTIFRFIVLTLVLALSLGCSKEDAFFNLCKVGAVAGNNSANYELAVYFEGKGQLDIALKHARSAAEGGHIQAQYDVGMYCFREREFDRACFWMEKVVENPTETHGHLLYRTYANQNLGQLFGFGLGVQKDKKRAIKHFNFSASLGSSGSEKFLLKVDEIGFENALAECWPWEKELLDSVAKKN